MDKEEKCRVVWGNPKGSDEKREVKRLEQKSI